MVVTLLIGATSVKSSSGCITVFCFLLNTPPCFNAFVTNSEQKYRGRKPKKVGQDPDIRRDNPIKKKPIKLNLQPLCNLSLIHI